MAAQMSSPKRSGLARSIGRTLRPDSLPTLGLTMRVRVRMWRIAAALGLLRGTALPDGDSGEPQCQHDGSPPLCARCCWVFGLM